MTSAEVLTYYENKDAFIVKRTPNKRFHIDDSDDEEVSPRKKRILAFDSKDSTSESDNDSSEIESDFITQDTETASSDSDEVENNKETMIKNTFFIKDGLVLKRTLRDLFISEDSDKEGEIGNNSDNKKDNINISKEENVDLKLKEPISHRDNKYTAVYENNDENDEEDNSDEAPTTTSKQVLICEDEDAIVVKRNPNKRFRFDDSDDEEVPPRKKRVLDIDYEDSTSDIVVLRRTSKKLFVFKDSDDESETGNNSEEETYNKNVSKEGNVELKVDEPLSCSDGSNIKRDHFNKFSTFQPLVPETDIDDESDESEEDDSDESNSGGDDDDQGDFPDHYLDRIPLFTEEQKNVFEYVVKLVEDPPFRRRNPRVVHVEGPAGTGKTEMLKTLCDYVRESYKGHAIYAAATGVAALKCPYGRTAHSAFGFPLDLTYEEQQQCNINEFKEKDLAGADLIVLDEFQSVNITYIEMLDASLRELMFSDKMFGGKVIVLSGDSRQVIPVVPLADNPSAFSPLLFLNNAETKTFNLTHPCRTKKDINYLGFLKSLGSNSLPNIAIPKNSDTIYVPLPEITFTTSLQDLILAIYPDDILLDDPEKCARRSILAPTRLRAQMINNELATVASTITLKAEDVNANSNLFQEFFNSDLPEEKVFPEKELNLWKGCLCMIIRSIYIRSKKLFLLNGTKVIVEKIKSDYDEVWVRKLGDNDGQLICINRLIFKTHYMNEQFIRVQYPLTLCYATTIHKAQGQTFEMVGVDIQQHVFRHGQLYLALSRVRSRDDMILCVNENQVIDDVAHAVNVVNRALIRNDE